MAGVVGTFCEIYALISAAHEVCLTVEGNKERSRMLAARIQSFEAPIRRLQENGATKDGDTAESGLNNLIAVITDCIDFMKMYGTGGWKRFCFNAISCKAIEEQFNQLNEALSMASADLQFGLVVSLQDHEVAMREANRSDNDAMLPVIMQMLENNGLMNEKILQILTEKKESEKNEKENTASKMSKIEEVAPQIEEMLVRSASLIQFANDTEEERLTPRGDDPSRPVPHHHHKTRHSTFSDLKYMDVVMNKLDWDIRTSYMIGKGEMACVYAGNYEGRPCAIKHFENIHQATEKQKRELQTEARIMQLIKHAHIIEIFGFSLSKGLILIELAHCSVHDVLHRGKGLPRGLTLTKPLKIRWIVSLAQALRYLHFHDITHCDVKPVNILLVDNGHEVVAKVADFGISLADGLTTLSQHRPEGADLRMLPYLAPELIKVLRTGADREDSGYTQTHAVDMYAFGVTVNEIMSEVVPWVGCKAAQIEVQVENQLRPEPFTANSDNEQKLRDLIGDAESGCLAGEASARPTSSMLLGFLENIYKGILQEASDAATRAIREGGLDAAKLVQDVQTEYADPLKLETDTTPVNRDSGIFDIYAAQRRESSSKVMVPRDTEGGETLQRKPSKKNNVMSIDSSSVSNTATKNVPTAPASSSSEGIHREARKSSVTPSVQRRKSSLNVILERVAKRPSAAGADGGILPDATDRPTVEMYLKAAARGDSAAQYNLGVMYENGSGVVQNDSEAARFYALAALQGDSFAETSLAGMFDEGRGVDQDSEEASRLYRRAANQGDAYAQCALARMLVEGKGIEKDAEEGVRFYKLAAEQDDAVAIGNLANLYEQGVGVNKDFAEAARLYALAADTGDAYSQVGLGALLLEGKGAEKDEKRAYNLFVSAAETGDLSAKWNLANMFADGNYVKQDDDEAVRLYREAAEGGLPTAQFSLGFFYAGGRGVEQDDRQAVSLYEVAAEQGEPNAIFQLAEMCSLGKGTLKDEKRAFSLYQEAASLGIDAARTRLGLMASAGAGVDRNDAQAVEHYRHAANEGDVAAMCNLGNMLKEGKGVAKNATEAAEWYKKAADKNNAYAECMLAGMYAEGAGINRNDSEALRYYKMAAENGVPVAQYNLAKFYSEGRGTDVNDSESYIWFCAAAKSNVAPAKHSLARMLIEGRGCNKNVAEALNLFHDAFQSGSVAAYISLGSLYATGEGLDKDEAKAAELFTKAAEKDSVPAMHNLALMYASGRGVEKDDPQAAALFKQAADKGDADSAYNFGVMSMEGRGIPKNMVDARKYLELAALAEVPEALETLRKI